MIALARYELSLLLRSYRWIPPVVLFGLGVVGLGGGGLPGKAGLSEGLAWSALMLVPVEAWLTRSMLSAEPPAARACVAAAGGPRQAQLAALIAPAILGVAIGLVGVGWEIASLGVPTSGLANTVDVGALAGAVGGGLAAALVCLLVGSAVAALLNSPVVRRSAVSMLATTGAVVLALAWNGSPANAAVRGFGYGAEEHTWPVGVTLVSAVTVAAVAWVISVQVAARRDG